MNKPWYKDSMLWFQITTIVVLGSFFVTILIIALNNTEYHMIMDDQAIERKCVKTSIVYHRDVYTDENGNVVLTIDRVREGW